MKGIFVFRSKIKEMEVSNLTGDIDTSVSINIILRKYSEKVIVRYLNIGLSNKVYLYRYIFNDGHPSFKQFLASHS